MNTNAVGGTSSRIFRIVVNIILIFCTLCALLPFWMLIASSFTSEDALAQFGYSFWPKEWSVYAYEWLFSTNGMRVLQAYGVTLFITVFGTGLSLLITPLLAYPLSRRDYKRARFFTFLVFFAMLFNGGVVPSYIMWTQFFHIKDTIWAWIFPNLLFTGFFVILYKNYFSSSIHPTLIEAAKIDGAGEWRIYFTIVLYHGHQAVFPPAIPEKHHRQHHGPGQHGCGQLGGHAKHLHPHGHRRGGYGAYPAAVPLLPEGVCGGDCPGRCEGVTRCISRGGPVDIQRVPYKY